MGEEAPPIRPEAIEVTYDEDLRPHQPVRLPPLTTLTPEEARALANNIDATLREHVGVGPEGDDAGA